MNIEQILAMALGLLMGNLFIYGIFKKDWMAGLFIGSVAAILFIPLMLIYTYLTA